MAKSALIPWASVNVYVLNLVRIYNSLVLMIVMKCPSGDVCLSGACCAQSSVCGTPPNATCGVSHSSADQLLYIMIADPLGNKVPIRLNLCEWFLLSQYSRLWQWSFCNMRRKWSPKERGLQVLSYELATVSHWKSLCIRRLLQCYRRLRQ